MRARQKTSIVPGLAASATYDPGCRRCRRLADFLDDVHAAHPDYWCKPVPPFGDDEARLVIVGYGKVGGIELAPAGAPGQRGYGVFIDCYDQGVLVRVTGDIVALSPPLIIERSQIDEIVDALRGAIQRAA